MASRALRATLARLADEALRHGRLAVAAAAALAIGAALVVAVRRASAQPPAGDAGEDAAVVTSLHIYPVKGLRGHAVESAELTPTGLAFDRRWLVVDIDPTTSVGRFVSQRELPRLATLTPCVRVVGECNEEAAHAVPSCFSASASVVLRLSAAPTASAPSPPPSVDVPLLGAGAGRSVPVTVWSSSLSAVDQGDAAAAWLRAALHGDDFDATSLRLVAMDEELQGGVRALSAKWLPRGGLLLRLAELLRLPAGLALAAATWLAGGLSDRVSFADGYPVLLASQASLDDLNRRIVAGAGEGASTGGDASASDPFAGHAVPIARFRPNVVVGTVLTAALPLQPWAEESWLRLRFCGVGGDPAQEVFMRGVKRCSRCVVPTTDQETGARGRGDAELREPLRTLATFRRGVDTGELFFAINCVVEWAALASRPPPRRMLRIGDSVRVFERGVMRPQ